MRVAALTFAIRGLTMPRHTARCRTASVASPTPAARSATATTQRDYDRARDLPRLIALWPHELAATSPIEHDRLLAKLRHALRGERRRGAGGHWAYDLARHAQLLRAYRAEVALALAARKPPRASRTTVQHASSLTDHFQTALPPTR